MSSSMTDNECIEALICTQNWLRSTPIVDIRRCLDEIEYLESEVLKDIAEIKLD
ncbi:hypothetical protein TorRG33x02_017010 [Trema orientale]|uniref:HAT, C-terminal dimerization domain containing protein n=1 Tax=Trema orientale TaxID=63057 RepID=A0A2P5FY59_TREOI|nr:hypothetical protein TorRG33x02_017010 [Trema orientale]